MRDHSNHIVSSRHEAVNELMGEWDFERRTETVKVANAVDRVAAQTLYSKNELPNALTSNMDGVAVHFDDFIDGDPDTSDWVRGDQWQFCNTGIAMPEGYDTAIMIESVEISDDDEHIVIHDMPQERYEKTTPPGANIAIGDLLVCEGEKLTPSLLSCLNMGGYTEVEVIARPRVAFIPTGNELVEPGEEVPKGKNVETNSVMACAKFQEWGAEPIRMSIVPDDPKKILSVLKRAAKRADIIVINAGSSKGSDDYTCELLEQEGRILCHEMNQGPGRHCSMAILEGKPVIGISGPPIGAEFTVDFFVKPFVDLYLEQPLNYPPRVWARMSDDCLMNPRPVNLVRRVVLERDENDYFVAHLHDIEETPVLRDCEKANAIVVIDTDSYGWQRGDYMPIELRYPYLLPPSRRW